jgi:hypothetical protein
LFEWKGAYRNGLWVQNTAKINNEVSEKMTGKLSKFTRNGVNYLVGASQNKNLLKFRRKEESAVTTATYAEVNFNKKHRVAVNKPGNFSRS